MATLLGQPSRRVGEEEHAEQEQDGGDYLDRQRYTELSSRFQELTTVSDPVKALAMIRGDGGGSGGKSPVGHKEAPGDHHLGPT